MEITNFGLSVKAFEIAKERPRAWEFLLLAQALEDEITSINRVLNQELGIKSNYQSQFNAIKNLSDLSRIMIDVSKEIGVVEKFMTVFTEISSSSNESAFGPLGKPGNPVLIQMIAKRTANIYYEMAIFVKRMEMEREFFKNFLHRNIDPSIEKFRSLCNAIEAANTWYIVNTKNLMRTIENYSEIVRSKINVASSGDKSISLTIEVEPEGQDELMEALSLASVFMKNEMNREGTAGTSITDTSNHFKSLSDVVDWIAKQEEVQKSDLRTMLLPLDYFPGAFIDKINEISLELFDEIALEELNDTVNVNQEILTKSLSNLHSIQLFSEIHNFELDGQSNLNRKTTHQKTREEVNDAHSEMTQKVDHGDQTYIEAMNYDLPYGIYPQDKKEALRLYKKAAELGNLLAYTKIGEMYEEGEGVKVSEDKAIEYYRKGANCGNIYCYYKMACVYINKQDLPNSQKCFALFTEKFKQIGFVKNLMIDKEDLRFIAFEIVTCYQKLADDENNLLARPSYFPLLPEFYKFLMEISLALHDHVIECFEEFIAKSDEFNHIKGALEYFRSYAIENSK